MHFLRVAAVTVALVGFLLAVAAVHGWQQHADASARAESHLATAQAALDSGDLARAERYTSFAEYDVEETYDRLIGARIITAGAAILLPLGCYLYWRAARRRPVTMENPL